MPKPQEMEKCLNFMKSRGRTNLILDLRTNGGGYLTVCQELATYFMRNATGSRPIVSTARFKSGRETIYRATGNRFSEFFEEDARIYVLADENTASASEMLIGAMVTYGTTPFSDIYLREENGVARSYGKGIMQQHYADSFGNVLKLTTAEIFWPDDTSIHGVGVTPADGAQAIAAPLLPGAEDIFLTQLMERL